MGLGLIAAEVRQGDGTDRQVRSLPGVVTESSPPKPVGLNPPPSGQEARPSPSEPVVEATGDEPADTGQIASDAPATEAAPGGGGLLTMETVTFETVELPAEMGDPAGPAPEPPLVVYVPPAPLSLVPPPGVPVLPRPGSGSFNALPEGSPIASGPDIRPPADLDLDLPEPSDPSGPRFSGPIFSDP